MTNFTERHEAAPGRALVPSGVVPPAPEGCDPGQVLVWWQGGEGSATLAKPAGRLERPWGSRPAGWKDPGEVGPPAAKTPGKSAGQPDASSPENLAKSRPARLGAFCHRVAHRACTPTACKASGQSYGKTIRTSPYGTLSGVQPQGVKPTCKLVLKPHVSAQHVFPLEQGRTSRLAPSVRLTLARATQSFKERPLKKKARKQRTACVAKKRKRAYFLAFMALPFFMAFIAGASSAAAAFFMAFFMAFFIATFIAFFMAAIM